ncbi:hypothetical protein [Bacterioplanoides sp.]|uniref:hypothetical protein n=1 Tax=Bacterioplanoides sp. TaxID=2066072 RepID=UPI003B003290
MSTTNKPRDLLDELETLQQVLDDAASDQVNQDKLIPTLDPMTDIPVLDDLFGIDENADLTLPDELTSNDLSSDSLSSEPSPLQASPLSAVPPAGNPLEKPALRAVSAAQPTALQSAPPAEPQSPIPDNFSRSSVSIPADSLKSSPSSNPFLPKAILEKLAQEREAAQYSAEQAQATMAKIMSNAPEEPFRFDHEKTKASTDSNGISSLEKAALIDELVKEMLPEIEARLRKALHEKL